MVFKAENKQTDGISNANDKVRSGANSENKTVSHNKKPNDSVVSKMKNSTYIIEPIKPSFRLRKYALISVMILSFLLSGFIFRYGKLIVDPYGSSLENIAPGKHHRVNSGDSTTTILSKDDSPIKITLLASSVEKDLSVRIVGEDTYPILGYVFQIEVLTPDGQISTYIDQDKTGRFYIADLPSGEYVVSMVPQEGFLTPEPIEVEVLDKVKFVEIVNIAEKIVKQKDVDSAAEDPQYKNAGNADAGTPSVVEPPKNTVEYVESKVVEVKTYRYTANTGEDGRLYTKDGVLTDIIPVIVDGYLTENGDYTMYEAPQEEPEEEPEEPDNPDEGGDINIFEKDQDGIFIYDITEHVETKTTYYGWQDIEGKRYYFDKNGKKVTGNQVINGHSYSFNSEGVLITSGTTMIGIDVSTWQNYIDWNKVKAAGVEFVMIRAGFRGYGSGLLVEDDLFYTNLKGAKAAGLRVGVYFFSQAINEKEGVEEASMVVSLIRKYGISLDYPIAFDSEYSGASGNSGRADKLSRSERTAVAVAFCETIRSAGYSPMVYASKSWFETNLSTGSFSNYYIWLAHYTSGGASSSYSGRYEMWQYTSQGNVNGIAGSVDMNYGYLGY